MNTAICQQVLARYKRGIIKSTWGVEPGGRVSEQCVLARVLAVALLRTLARGARRPGDLVDEGVSTAMSLALRVGLGGQLSEYLEIVDVLLPPWSAVPQVRELLLHGEHAGDAHGQYRRAIECPRLVAEGAWRE
jgi:hypothetical protein